MRASSHIMVKGAALGATLGRLRLGEGAYRPIFEFEPQPGEIELQEGFSAWLAWSKHLSERLPPEAICESRISQLDLSSTEAVFGNQNLKLGFRPPLSGSFRHPLAISATVWTRCLFWGLALLPNDAARYAYWDAATDQTSDSALIAATLAANLFADSPMDWLRRMLGLSERAPAARAMLRLVADGAVRGESAQSLSELIRNSAPQGDAYDAVSNLGFLASALIMGAGDFKRTALSAVSSGGQSVSTGALAAAMAARWYGIPDDWETHLSGLRVRGEPLTEFFAELGSEEPPRLPDPEATPSPPVELPTLPSSVSAHCRGDLVVSVTYEDLAVAYPGQSIRCVAQLENRGDERQLKPSATYPEGWVVAHRLSPIRLPLGGRASFPFVIQPTTDGGAAQLHLDELEPVPLVAIAPQKWHVCGPFGNYDGMGFHKSFKAEDVWRLGEVFAGRGTGGVQWRERAFAGLVLDPEPYFTGSAGVVYLYAQVEFQSPGTYTLVASGSPGVVVMVNRQQVVRYQNPIRPAARPMAPCVGQFKAEGRVDLLVKLIRENSPISPLTLYFLDANGRVVEPVAWLSMPR